MELSDSTGWNYIMKTTDPPERIYRYYMKTMKTIGWTLHNEVPSQGGTLSFTTQKGVPIEVKNLKSNILIFTDYRNLLEIRVLTDSISNETIIVVSSKLKESASKQTTAHDDK